MLRRAVAGALVLFVLMPATVQAFDHDHHHSSHHSSGGDGCGSSSSSEASPSPSTPKPSTSVHKRVFVTHASFSGALGGVASADAQCQSAASAQRLPGVFHAWISDDANDAYDRVTGTGPWYTTGDKLAFSTKAGLRQAPASELLDEAGGSPAGSQPVRAWTGSDAAGTATGDNCDGWTNATADAIATTGSALRSDAEWGGGGDAVHCDEKAQLLCFQQ